MSREGVAISLHGRREPFVAHGGYHLVPATSLVVERHGARLCRIRFEVAVDAAGFSLGSEKSLVQSFLPEHQRGPFVGITYLDISEIEAN